MMTQWLVPYVLVPLAWSVCVIAGSVAVVAVLSPRAFRSLAVQGGRWFDTRRIQEWLDRPHDIDNLLLRYPRVLVGLTLVAALYLGWLLYQ